MKQCSIKILIVIGIAFVIFFIAVFAGVYLAARNYFES